MSGAKTLVLKTFIVMAFATIKMNFAAFTVTFVAITMTFVTIIIILVAITKISILMEFVPMRIDVLKFSSKDISSVSNDIRSKMSTNLNEHLIYI